MTIIDDRARRDAATARILEIEAQLAESKRAYIVDHVAQPFALRVTLEAERANLLCERNTLTQQINQLERAQRQARGLSAHTHLIRLVTEAGMGHLVGQSVRLAEDIEL